MADPYTWQNYSPGNLDILLESVSATDVSPAVEKAVKAHVAWASLSILEKWSALEKVRAQLEIQSEKLASQIALEVGKTLTESRGEMGAVLAKFALTLEDAEMYLQETSVSQGPHPASIRRLSRGPAAVVGPFNFPLHLGNGAILAHLLAGNPVLYKPSPLAPIVAEAYGKILTSYLPEGVFQIVQGRGETSRELCLHRDVRSICFTGSVGVGRELAISLAGDFSKDLALELGGKNALFVAADADLVAAAKAAADGLCLTAGQRCNGTSRIFVEEAVAGEFGRFLKAALSDYLPADPMLVSSKLGPVISELSRLRHEKLVENHRAEVFTSMPSTLKGHYVLPAVIWKKLGDGLLKEEQFVPVVESVSTPNLESAVECQSRSGFGMTAAIFTKSRKTFQWFASSMRVGNVYANLPTTFSPSTLPFGGLKNSGNHRPGGKGFARFVADEQAAQWTGLDG